MLTVFGIQDRDKWDAALAECHLYDVYYKREYVRAFEVYGDGEPLMFYYKDERISAINIVMKRDIAKVPRFAPLLEDSRYFDLSTPYGYGGFVISGDVCESSLMDLDKAYTEYCINNSIISEFVRFHPELDNARQLISIYDLLPLGKTISINTESPQVIWNNITSKNRNMIRKALKNGVETYWGRSRELTNSFIDLYYRTMDKDDADDYYYFNKKFFESILYELKNHSLFFYTIYQDTMISCAIILFSGTQMHYHLSASLPEFSQYAPTNLLLYQASLWGSANGYKTFHLGGGLGGKEDSLYKFKASFNRNSDCNFCIGKKIFDNKAYNELVSIKNKDQEYSEPNSFFPAYRG